MLIILKLHIKGYVAAEFRHGKWDISGDDEENNNTQLKIEKTCIFIFREKIILSQIFLNLN